MKKYSIYDIRGGEILANPIMTSSYQILLSEGTVLQKEYIENFEQLNISYVYIYEEKDILNRDIEKARKEAADYFKTQVKSVLEKHIYSKNNNLQKLSGTAHGIMDNILKERKIVEELIEMKQKSEDLYEHSLNCCTLSMILSLRLNYNNEIVHAIGVGCLLHDIGLRFMSIKYHNISLSNMPENQRAEYKKHSIYGYSSVENENWLHMVSKDIILYHHERMDGTGYPFRKKKVSEPIAIAIVCDVFDEMVSGIGFEYSKVHKAIEYLKCFRNVKFDAKIVNEFLKVVAAYPVGSHVLTNKGEIGIVIRQNKGFPERPVLRIVIDRYGRDICKDNTVDLLKENSVFIEEVIND
ncbi:HD domain-containing phosphohydrolase [Lachnospiraceae bacterium JLR.KK008]